MDGWSVPSDAELGALPAAERIDLLIALERQRRRVDAAQLRVLATFTWTINTGHHYTSPTSQTWPDQPDF